MFTTTRAQPGDGLNPECGIGQEQAMTEEVVGQCEEALIRAQVCVASASQLAKGDPRPSSRW